MAKQPKIFEDMTNVLADASDAISDEVKKQQIALFFREKQKDLDDLRETRKRIQEENREKVKEAAPSTADINYTGALVKHLPPGRSPSLRIPVTVTSSGRERSSPVANRGCLWT